MSFTPMISLVTTTHFITLILDVIIKEMDLEISADSIVNFSPSPEYLRNVINDTATEVLVVVCQKAYKALLFSSIDAANKSCNHHTIKKIHK